MPVGAWSRTGDDARPNTSTASQRSGQSSWGGGIRPRNARPGKKSSCNLKSLKHFLNGRASRPRLFTPRHSRSLLSCGHGTNKPFPDRPTAVALARGARRRRAARRTGLRVRQAAQRGRPGEAETTPSARPPGGDSAVPHPPDQVGGGEHAAPWQVRVAQVAKEGPRLTRTNWKPVSAAN